MVELLTNKRIVCHKIRQDLLPIFVTSFEIQIWLKLMWNRSCHHGERFSNTISGKLWKHNHKIHSQGTAYDKADRQMKFNVTLVCETLPSGEIKTQQQRCQHLPWATSLSCEQEEWHTLTCSQIRETVQALWSLKDRGEIDSIRRLYISRVEQMWTSLRISLPSHFQG